MFHGGTAKRQISCFFVINKKGVERQIMTDFEVKFSVPTIKYELSEMPETHGTRYTPVLPCEVSWSSATKNSSAE
jgi:hypothetical protein